MLGHLSHLRRLLFLEVRRPFLLLTSARHLSALFSPPPITAYGGKGRTSPPLSYQLKKRRDGGFCTRAVGAEDMAADLTSSLYLSVRISCRKDVAIILSEALLCFGASSASMDEETDSKDDDETCITSIFVDDQDVNACISHAADSIGLNYVPIFEVSMGEHCDWIANVQETFHPIKVTNGLWIVPEWRTPLDSQATNIILNPGIAFGTGEHPTTKLCLLLLHGLIKGGECFLDYGTGSGVLGVAAVKMGAALSVGIDIDPQAVASARQNIALNKIDSSRMLVYLVPSKVGPHTVVGRSSNNPEDKTPYDLEINATREKFDIVIANILLNPLLELAEDIVAYGKPGAIIGVSGILSEQLHQIQELYSRFLDSVSISEIDGWACLSGTKR